MFPSRVLASDAVVIAVEAVLVWTDDIHATHVVGPMARSSQAVDVADPDRDTLALVAGVTSTASDGCWSFRTESWTVRFRGLRSTTRRFST
jgi:hypothetical protein